MWSYVLVKQETNFHHAFIRICVYHSSNKRSCLTKEITWRFGLCEIPLYCDIQNVITINQIPKNILG